MSKKLYDVISPDGFPISCEPFKTKKAARAAIPVWCSSFERQGYYSTSYRERISLPELPQRLNVVPQKTSGSVADTRTDLSFNTRHYGKAKIVTNAYRKGGSLGVELVDTNGETLAILSVNIPEFSHLLGDNEFFVKTWSENEEFAKDALASGLFRQTGRWSKGYISAPVWALK